MKAFLRFIGIDLFLGLAFWIKVELVWKWWGWQ